MTTTTQTHAATLRPLVLGDYPIWFRIGTAMILGAEVPIWIRIGTGSINIPVKCGAYAVTMGVEVAVDGPGGVEHGQPLGTLPALRALQACGIQTE